MLSATYHNRQATHFVFIGLNSVSLSIKDVWPLALIGFELLLSYAIEKYTAESWLLDENESRANGWLLDFPTIACLVPWCTKGGNRAEKPES